MPTTIGYRLLCAIILTLLGVALYQPFAAVSQGKRDGLVKEILLPGLKSLRPKAKASVFKPVEIKNGKQLARAIGNKELQAQIAKQVDFKKSNAMLFLWQGSGGDRLAQTVKITTAGKSVVVFRYSAGFTDDLRLHVKLYAIPQGVKWAVKK